MPEENSSSLAWKIPWTEEPGRLQSKGSLRVGHDRATSLSLFTFMHWRRKWQPTPVFLPGESQGRGSLVDCRLRGRTESDMTDATQQQPQTRHLILDYTALGSYHEKIILRTILLAQAAVAKYHGLGGLNNLDQVQVRAPFLACRWMPFAVSSHGRERELCVSSSSYKDANLTRGLPWCLRW